MSNERDNQMYNKWKKAQQLELGVWERQSKFPFNSGYLENRAAIIYRWLKLFMEIEENTKILEIGGAGMAVVNYFSRCKGFSADPLVYYYKKYFP